MEILTLSQNTFKRDPIFWMSQCSPSILVVVENINTLHVAKSLKEQEKPKFIKLFEGRQIKFSWSYVDMIGIDLDLIMHHLSLPPGVKLVKKKSRKMHPHITLLVKEKLKIFFDVGFIRPIDYVEWISNIVSVSKLDGSIRICTNFRDSIKIVQRMISPYQTLISSCI